MAENLRRMGPLSPEHPLVRDSLLPCPACHQSFVAGDYVTLVSLGPGTDEEERRKARAGAAYTAVAVCVHWGCATGGDHEV